MSAFLKNAQQFSHQLLKECVLPGDTVIDATMGNGHDCLFLAQLVGPQGHVYAFDVQQAAYDATEKRLQTHNCLKQCHLFLQGHELAHQSLPTNTQLKAVIFNLGYLPSGDKHIVTKASATLSAVASLLPYLSIKGRLLLVCYTGHDGGQDEFEQLNHYVRQLDQSLYTVLHYQFLNQINHPPSLLVIERRK